MRQTIFKIVQRRLPARILIFFIFASCLYGALPSIVFAQSYTVNVSAEKLDTTLLEQIQANLSLNRLKDSPYLSHDYIERLYTKGVSEIEKALRVFGYYKAKISGEINKEQEVWAISYNIDAGPPLTVQKVDVVISGNGRNDKAIREWYSTLPFKTGNTLDQQQYEKTKNSIRQIMLDQGYLEGKIAVHELRVSLINNNAEIVLHVDTGERFYFGDITFLQDIFDEKYVNNFLTFKKGDFYESAKLTELQMQLSQSGEFQKIEITPQMEKASEKYVPVNVLLVPRKPQRYIFGLGYGTDTGARVRLGAQRRQITRTGHRAAFEVLYSQIRTEFNANYYIPLDRPATDYFDISAARVVEDTDDLYRETNSSSISTVTASKYWLRTLKLTYLDESFEIGDEDGTSQLVIPSIAFSLIPDKKWSVDTLQWRLSMEVKGADEDLMSDTTFVQSRVILQNRLRLLPKMSLVSRADVGWSDIDEFSVLPVSLRFFAGGDTSIRGYGYNTLGPENENGDVVGGSHLLVGSVEVQYKLSQAWDIAAFTDAGNAYNKNDLKVKQGAGIGFGYALPVGSLRAYAATALTESGLPWRLHITVGAQW